MEKPSKMKFPFLQCMYLPTLYTCAMQAREKMQCTDYEYKTRAKDGKKICGNKAQNTK